MNVLKSKTEQLNGKPHLSILVDEFPELEYREIVCATGEVFFYAERDGLVGCYHHAPGSTDGYGGRATTLKMQDGSERTFKGQLWNHWKRHTLPEIPAHVEVSATNDPKVWARGHTFFAAAITKELADQLLAENATAPTSQAASA